VKILNVNLFVQGLIAGYGIAVPVGPIAILIIEIGIRRGFSVAFCAGAGAASADLIYATIAALAGGLLVSILNPYSTIIHTASALVLIALGFWLLYTGARNDNAKKNGEFRITTHAGAYGFVFALTLFNPLTVAYFTTLILGLRSNISSSPENMVLFVFGTFLASLSWQSTIACIGGFGHERLSPRLRLATFAIGNAIIILIGILLLFGISI
jgi:arginine exporter protein ArgO